MMPIVTKMFSTGTVAGKFHLSLQFRKVLVLPVSPFNSDRVHIFNAGSSHGTTAVGLCSFLCTRSLRTETLIRKMTRLYPQSNQESD